MHSILIINHYAGSPDYGMEYRSFYFAREWIKAGHRVLIVAASYAHIRQKNPVVRNALTRETIDGVDYLWVRTPAYRGNGIRRVLNMLAFVWGLCWRCRKTIAAFQPDLVIASSTYTWDNWPAAYYARRHHARYAYELHDVWPSTPMELSGMKAWHPFIWSLQRAENFACRHADNVISLLPGAQPHLSSHGMPSDRFVYIPNGVVREEWDNAQAVPAEHIEAIAALRKQKKHLVGYVGNLGISNALDALVEAGAHPALKDVVVVCVGRGQDAERLRAKARAIHSPVVFLPPVPRRSVPRLLPLFDVLSIGWARSPLYRFGISPNKLFEYMMSGVPIVHAVDASNDPVREASCGVSVPPEDVPALCAGIRTLIALSPGERRAMGERGQRHVQEHHAIDTLARRLLETVWASDPAAHSSGTVIPAQAAALTRSALHEGLTGSR